MYGLFEFTSKADALSPLLLCVLELSSKVDKLTTTTGCLRVHIEGTLPLLGGVEFVSRVDVLSLLLMSVCKISTKELPLLILVERRDRLVSI